MIIGVMSDTHGHLTEMRRAARRMVEEFKATVIFHLGDDSTDADELLGITEEVIVVPGIYELRYKDPTFPSRVIKKLGGVPFLATHTPTKDHRDRPQDLDPTELAQDGDVKVVLYGHTHKPEMAERNKAIYINPGHLKGNDDRGYPMTFAIIELAPPKMDVKIIEVDNGPIEEKRFIVG